MRWLKTWCARFDWAWKAKFFIDGDRFARLSWSQEGEDLLIDRFFQDEHVGFFVDVGAHHPTRFSNTFYFYQKGWRGILIDATPGLDLLFKAKRPGDVFENSAVAKNAGDLKFFCYAETALNSLQIRSDLDTDLLSATESVVVPAAPLRDILAKLHCPRSFELLSVDVEGADLDVLRSNDWERFRPRYVVVEALEEVELFRDEGSEYLMGLGYKPVGATRFSRLFQDGVMSK